MSLIGTIGAIGSIGSTISDLANTGLNFANYYRNQSNIEKVWERDDNAVQRRVADLKAAGLSPTLAAGSAAQSSSANTLTAPQVKLNPQQIAQNYLALTQQKKNIEKTDAEIKNIELQYEKDKRDLDIIKGDSSGLRSTDNGVGAQVFNAVNAGLSLFTDKGIKPMSQASADTVGNVLKSAGAGIAEKVATFNNANTTKNSSNPVDNAQKISELPKDKQKQISKYEDFYEKKKAGKTTDTTKGIANKYKSYYKNKY